MRDITTSKEKLLKKVRKALLEKRDNPYPNLEDLPMYPPNEELLEVVFAEQFTAVSGQFVFCEDEVQFIENLLELEDEGEIYEGIEDIWSDYPSQDDFFFNEDEY